jgi:hypothetical protein
VVWLQNHLDDFHHFGLKTGGDGLLVVLPQNHSDGFHQFGLKTGGDSF